MPFLLLFILTPPCLQESWPEPGFGMTSPLRTVLLTWSAMASAVLVAALWSSWVRFRLARNPARRDSVLQRYGSWRVYHLLLLACLYGISLYVFGWGWAVQSLLQVSILPPGGELIILAPFLAGLGCSWVCFYRVERALHDTGSDPGRYWSLWDYMGYQVRHNLALVCLPIALLMVLKGLRWLTAGAHPFWALAATGLGFVAATGLFLAMPWLLRLVLGLKPLPAGPLRERLQTTARRLRFRSSDILLWDTRGGIANALVAGIFPMLRYVVLTDRLVAELTPDEVEAVFGHEIGHIKHRHMFYYLAFLLVSLSAVWAVVAIYALPHFNDVPSLGKRDDLAVLALVGVLAVYIFVVFGFISRNCERQADLYGCRVVSCVRTDCQGHEPSVALAGDGLGLCPTGIRIFIMALEKVGKLNGISRDRPGWLQSWQHSTIARRVGFLERVRVNPQVNLRFQRGLAVVKWALLLSLLAMLVVLGNFYGWDKLLF